MPTWFDNYQRTRDDEVARLGAAEAKNETVVGGMLHEVADLARGIIPIPKDSEERARENAYHSTPRRRESTESKTLSSPSRSSSIYGSGSGESSNSPWGRRILIWILIYIGSWVLLVVGWAFIQLLRGQ